jgi:hypothetical protein
MKQANFLLPIFKRGVVPMSEAKGVDVAIKESMKSVYLDDFTEPGIKFSSKFNVSENGISDFIEDFSMLGMPYSFLDNNSYTYIFTPETSTSKRKWTLISKEISRYSQSDTIEEINDGKGIRYKINVIAINETRAITICKQILKRYLAAKRS